MARTRGQTGGGAWRGWWGWVTRERVLDAAMAVAYVGLAGSVLLAGSRVMDGVRGRTAARAASVAERVEIEWPAIGGRGADPEATWLPERVQHELLDLAHARLREADAGTPDAWARLIDRDRLRGVGEALLGTGWFESITSVTREPEGVVRVRGAWRVPVAVVRWEGTDYVVGMGGRLLPVSYPEGGSNLPVILNAGQGPSRSVLGPGGAAWPGTDVAAGVDLLLYLRRLSAWGQVAGVDVGAYGTLKRLSIVTDRGTRVVWGGSPRDLVPGEVPAAEKFRRLESFGRDERFGRRIDAGRNLIEVFGRHTLIDVSAAAPESPVSP